MSRSGAVGRLNPSPPGVVQLHRADADRWDRIPARVARPAAAGVRDSIAQLADGIARWALPHVPHTVRAREVGQLPVLVGGARADGRFGTCRARAGRAFVPRLIAGLGCSAQALVEDTIGV